MNRRSWLLGLFCVGLLGWALWPRPTAVHPSTRAVWSSSDRSLDLRPVDPSVEAHGRQVLATTAQPPSGAGSPLGAGTAAGATGALPEKQDSKEGVLPLEASRDQAGRGGVSALGADESVRKASDRVESTYPSAPKQGFLQEIRQIISELPFLCLFFILLLLLFLNRGYRQGDPKKRP